MFFRISNLTPHELQSRIVLDIAEADEDPAMNEDNSESDRDEDEFDNNNEMNNFWNSSVALSDLVLEPTQPLEAGNKKFPSSTRILFISVSSKVLIST